RGAVEVRVQERQVHRADPSRGQGAQDGLEHDRPAGVRLLLQREPERGSPALEPGHRAPHRRVPPPEDPDVQRLRRPGRRALQRLLGLFAFFYAGLHFSVWLVVDHFFDWREMGADIVKRPYITVGMTALTLMLPLAATSTVGAIKKLGGKNWQRLHRLAYAI